MPQIHLAIQSQWSKSLRRIFCIAAILFGVILSLTISIQATEHVAPMNETLTAPKSNAAIPAADDDQIAPRVSSFKINGGQDAWLDADGNGRPNEFDDATIAAQRGFGFPGTFGNDNWPPHIFTVEPPLSITNFNGTIYADVRDDYDVKQVSAVIYPPSYTPPATRNELQAEALTEIILNPMPTLAGQHSQRTVQNIAEENRYGGSYNFVEEGTYRVVVYAEDREGLNARPVEVQFTVGVHTVYLPMIKR